LQSGFCRHELAKGVHVTFPPESCWQKLTFGSQLGPQSKVPQLPPAPPAPPLVGGPVDVELATLELEVTLADAPPEPAALVAPLP